MITIHEVQSCDMQLLLWQIWLLITIILNVLIICFIVLYLYYFTLHSHLFY